MPHGVFRQTLSISFMTDQDVFVTTPLFLDYHEFCRKDLLTKDSSPALLEFYLGHQETAYPEMKRNIYLHT
jgi:hypothetical protein